MREERGPLRSPLFMHTYLMQAHAGVRVAIGLGSNLGDRAENLRFGFVQLEQLLEGFRRSPVYATVPRHRTEQPRFLNACVVGWTRLGAHELLQTLQELEQAAGRRRDSGRYGPRVLDLDLLLYGNEVLHTPDLVVPHPRMHERGFVLIPLRDIAPEWRVPSSGDQPAATVAEMAAAVSAEGVEAVNRDLGPPEYLT